MTVRTRIAPSPTGDPHVGTAYVALFNYCFAKSQGGEFILRIEDTDQVRSTRASERMILHSLRWAGLQWDEGPDVGGPHGPYRQSERSAIYQEHTQRLLDSGHAFRCFCTSDRLKALRARQAAGEAGLGYDGHCLGLSGSESAARAAAGEPHVVRLKVPREGDCVFQDRLRGEIRIPWAQVDMQVLLKSDGLPTYHLANVVDDRLMRITHVIRGEEWINSAPKHLLLYAAFGWEPPQLCHLPLLRNPDKSKLSKRKNPTSLLWYEQQGYLPEGLLNYLGMMAWTMPDERELFSLDEMVAHFDLDRISLGGPVFDVPKLSWLNGRWLRERLDEDAFLDRALAWRGRDFLKKLVPLIRPRTQRFTDVLPLADYLFTHLVPLDAAAFGPESARAGIVRDFHFAVARFTAMPEWEKGAIEAEMRGLCDKTAQKLRNFVKPFFLAIAGRPSALPLFESMELLGRDLTRDRLNAVITLFGGLSKDEAKALDAELARLYAAAPAGDDEG
jgi:glutamyl-tRNA synthetase